MEVIETHRDLFKLKDPWFELGLSEVVEDNLGNNHVMFQQQYDGVPVFDFFDDESETNEIWVFDTFTGDAGFILETVPTSRSQVFPATTVTWLSSCGMRISSMFTRLHSPRVDWQRPVPMIFIYTRSSYRPG